MELKKYKLGDICDIFAGGDAPKNVTTERSEKNCIPIYSNGIVNEGLYGYTDVAKITSKAFTVSARGTIGISFKRNEPYYPIVRLLSVIPKNNNVDLDYLYYNSKMLIFKKDGSVQQQLTVPMLSEVEIKIPSIEYQRKIASVLSSLDNKIALNRRINAKFEQIAKRLYDYWFVQFDFPNEEGKPYKSSGGKMVWNEVLKREVPEGWEVLAINKLCQIIDCLHSKKPDYCYEDENSYLLSLENITKEGYIDLSNKYYISRKDFKEWTSRICVKENDFLFTNAGRAGDMGMVSEGISCAIGRNITAVRPKNISPWYLRCFFKSLYMQEQILNNLDKGSFFMSFNVRSIKKLQVLIPNESIMRKFVAFIEPHIKRIEKNNKEISRLTALRDKLLPLLMNGQVEVKG